MRANEHTFVWPVMKNRLSFLACCWVVCVGSILCVLGLPQVGRADDPILVDEFSDVFCTDEFRARVDTFFSEISARPALTGLVLWSRDVDIPGRAQRYVEIIRNHAQFRGFPPDRLRFAEFVVRDTTNFKFYVVPAAAAAKQLEPNRALTVVTTTLFDSSRIAQIKDGVVHFGELIDEPCDLGLNLRQYAAVFDDSGITAYLVASAGNRRAKKKVLSALRLTSEELSRSYKVPRRRIRTIYAGIRGETAMELWLVPKGGKAPKYRPGTL